MALWVNPKHRSDPDGTCSVCNKRGVKYTDKLRAGRVLIGLKESVALCDNQECQRTKAKKIQKETIEKARAWRARFQQALRAKVQEPAADL